MNESEADGYIRDKREYVDYMYIVHRVCCKSYSIYSSTSLRVALSTREIYIGCCALCAVRSVRCTYDATFAVKMLTFQLFVSVVCPTKCCAF